MRILTNLSLLLLSCLMLLTRSESDNPSLSNESSNGFTSKYDAIHNEYYKTNNVKSVTARFINTPSRQNIYHYNNLGDLFKVEIVDLNNLDYKNITEYELIYKNNQVTRRDYSDALLTKSVYTYNNDLLIKKADFREEELFYLSEYEYDESGFVESSTYFCYSSAGLGFGVACTDKTDFEYSYQNGNLITIENLNKDENILELIYNNDSNMPTIAIDNNIEIKLSYTYFN